MDQELDRLLQELEMAEVGVRKRAAEALAGRGRPDVRVLAALHKSALNDPHPAVQQAAREALVQLNATGADDLYVPPTQPRPRDAAFWAGFWGWYLGNLLLLGLLQSDALSSLGLDEIFPAAVFALNLLLLIAAMLVRPHVGFGMLTAFAGLIGLVVVLGVCLTAACFATGGLH